MRLKQLFSRRCCGGPILALALFCMGLGLLLVVLSAAVPGLVFMAVAGLSVGSCLVLGRYRCRRQLFPSEIVG